MTILEGAAIPVKSLTDGTAGVLETFQRHRSGIFKFALQLVGNSDDAMDLTQEAFLRFHRNWPAQDGSRDAAPWLFAVIRNLAYDLLRKRATRKEHDLEQVPVESRAPGPEVLALRNEVTARLWTAIGALPLAQREALLLRDWHGLSYAAIAEVTGANVNIVSSRIHEARMAVRRKMGGVYGPGPKS